VLTNRVSSLIFKKAKATIAGDLGELKRVLEANREGISSRGPVCSPLEGEAYPKIERPPRRKPRRPGDKGLLTYLGCGVVDLYFCLHPWRKLWVLDHSEVPSLF